VPGISSTWISGNDGTTVAQTKGIARRGLAKVRRVLSGSDAQAQAARIAKLQAQLDESHAKQARLREKVAELRGERAQLRTEFTVCRNSVRDPHPRLPVPDRVEQVITQVRQERLSYLSTPSLRVLARLALAADRDELPGLVIEAGTALGGSAIVMAAAKAAERPMKVYDVFGMIPEPSEQDGTDVHQRYEQITAGAATGVGGDVYYGYHDDLYAEVNASFARLGVATDATNVELVRGLFADTIHLDEPVALAHLDGDWYESTLTCLERIVPLLVPGGRVVLDDYFAWSGCRKAVDEYFAGRKGFLLEWRTKMHVVSL